MKPHAFGVDAVPILGVPVHPVSLTRALAIVNGAIERRERLRIGVVNAAKIVGMRADPGLREDVSSSDLVLADGMAVVWAGRMLGHRVRERVTGIDLMIGMLREGTERGYRVYCLGATEEVLAAVCRRIAVEYPGTVIAGSHHGYFSQVDEPALADRIASSRPDILLVAMTSPKKEKFLARWGAHIGAPVCHGVGGSFDVLAGKVRRAPERWQRLGLEWLYRLKQEPGRLWRRYLYTNTTFCVLLLRECWRRLALGLTSRRARPDP